jgi:hypothetical protein
MNRGATEASVVKQERERDGGARVSRNGGGSGKSEKARREIAGIEALVGVPTVRRRPICPVSHTI